MLYFLKDRYRDFRGEVLAIPGRIIALIFFLLLLMVPLFSKSPYLLKFLIYTNIFVIFAVSWDLLSGYVGQINLGHALFFGVAAYTDALLHIHFGLPPWLAILCGACASVLAGLVIGIVALRLRGVYFALVTLAFPIILSGVVLTWHELTGGEFGLSGISRLTSSRVMDYYFVLGTMAVSVLVMWKLTDVRSRIIRTAVIFHAIREDEVTARISGINTTRYKLAAFAVSAFFAGITGGLYTHVLRVVGPSTLELSLSLNAFIWTIFGGLGTIYGPVVGVYIIHPMLELLTFVPWLIKFRTLILALLLIIVILFMPQGIARRIKDKIEKECPRCKLTNAFTRKECRACGAELA
ncbi:branched-chain amino acid ABC transporter permease [Thermodesulfobacteriota bacterium]